MTIVFRARYATAADLTRQLEEHTARGALLLPLVTPAEGLRQFNQVTLELCLHDESAELAAEVLQVLPGVGLVLRLIEPELAQVLLEAGDAEAAPAQLAAAVPVEVSLIDEAETAAVDAAESIGAEGADDEGAQVATARTLGPLSWSVEKLQAEWHTLPLGDRVRVAKYGKRAARGLILRMTDNTLHNVLLSNPQITTDEVAILAGTGSVDNTVLKRILNNPEWVRHTAVARNLASHPKATLQQVSKAADHLNDNELRQLSRTGRVRASAKRLLMKKLEQRAARVRR